MEFLWVGFERGELAMLEILTSEDSVMTRLGDDRKMAIWMKRLERGTFQRPLFKDDCNHVEMDATELTLLLSGIDLKSVKRRKRYAIDSQYRALIEESITR